MKKLYKIRQNKVLLGVCGGVAEYLEIDPTVVRLIWFILGFTFVGAVAYFAAGLILPFKDDIAG